MTRAVNITLEDGDLLATIDRAIRVLQQPRAMLQDVGDKLEGNIRLRFASKTDPSGNKWAPLSPATVEIYTSDWFIERNPSFKGGIPGTLLERTGRLLNSLAFNVGPDWLEIGTSRTVPGKSQPTWEVGLLHEFGTKTMPRRGILTANPNTGELGAGDEADLLQVLQGFLGEAFG